MKPIWKNVLAAAALLAVAGAAGCVVPCLQPLFTDQDATFDPALLGTWETNKETFTFTRHQDKNEYRILDRQASGSQATLAAWTGRIGGKDYLCATLDPEAMPELGRMFLFPNHTLVFRIEQTAPELRLVALNLEACKKLLQGKPDATPHVMLKPTDEKDAIPVLTGSTAELQRFVREYGDAAGLFPAKEALTFKRPVKGGELQP
ncbi:MAG: hypothetical protein WC708_02810 [Lentisphaeria bacterium]